ncbi:MAG: SDR family NAD(P)-dependent oxidoreductase [Thermodesulfobacteriota bacterium]
MYADLRGKTALITGSGKRTGIGYAIAEKLAFCKANVIIADLGKRADKTTPIKMGSREEMESIAEELNQKYGVKAIAVDLDITSNDSIAQMLAEIKKEFATVDVLINNAGASFGAPSPAHLYNEEAWLKTIDVNLHGAFRVSRAVIPMMMAQKEGTIVNVSSKAGKTPPLANGAYAVAKAGLIMLTKVMALELANQGIRVNAVCPGIIMTDLQVFRFQMEAKFFQTSIEEREKDWAKQIPQGRIGSPQDVADLVVYLASKESAYITGQAINVDGGLLMAL